jgi:predicted ATPase with chaperone activity
MVGSPGAGKTMLARRLPTLLPDLSHEEALGGTLLQGYSRNHYAGVRAWTTMTDEVVLAAGAGAAESHPE